MVEEALTISDLFSLSELTSVELLFEAEEQMQYFHGFNRGLTAILLYYDSKRFFVNNLRTLLVARPGRTWALDENLPNEISNFLDDYVNRLLEKGLISKILSKPSLFCSSLFEMHIQKCFCFKGQVSSHDWVKAEENLQRVNGLGNLKHRKQVNIF
jgi:hypothetical protein